MVARKKLRKITQEEFNKIASKHLSFLAGNKESRADFSYCNFKNIDVRDVDLSGANFQGADLSNIGPEYIQYESSIFSGTILRNVDFRGAILPESSFELATVDGMILIGTHFNQKQFSPEQKKRIILTEEQLKIKEQEGTIQKQEKVIEQVGEKRTKELQQGFIELKDSFAKEEHRWLFLSITVFVILLLTTFIPILFSIGFNGTEKYVVYFLIFVVAIIVGFIFTIADLGKERKSENKDWLSVLFEKRWIQAILLLISSYILIEIVFPSLKGGIDVDYKKMLPYIPLEVICLTFLYFCIYQFSKAKNLRIEQQNKIAIISGFQAIKADDALENDNNDKMLRYFASNISDVLFCKANEKSDQNLPIDKVVEAAKLIKDLSAK